MCGRFNDHLPISHSWSQILRNWPELKPSFNRAPTEQIAAFSNLGGSLMRWGLIPPWATSFESRHSTFNARIESVNEKPTFRNAWLKKQRCLIPMAGYYEWLGEKGNKMPFYVTLSDQTATPLVAAGLYERWPNNPSGYRSQSFDQQLSCTVLTQTANDELKAIHHRMPILVRLDQANSWLRGECGASELIPPKLRYHRVGQAVGNTRNDSPDLITPLLF